MINHFLARMRHQICKRHTYTCFTLLFISRRCGFETSADYGLAMRVYGLVFLGGVCFSQPFYPALREARARGAHESGVGCHG